MKIAVGLDIGGTNTKIILADENGEVLAGRQAATPSVSGAGAGKTEGDRIEDLLIKNLKDFMNDEAVKPLISHADLAGIGLGVAGFIDRKNGLIIKSPNIAALNGLAVRELFETEFSLPVAVENDANAYAYGERWIGTGKDIDNFVVLTLGTGLGGGHIYKGELYEGPFEIGHMIMEPDGRFCTCGSHGCLESYASGRAIVDRVIKALEDGAKSMLAECCDGNFYKITPDLVFQKALDGDNLSREAFREVGRYLGVGIANIINIFRIDAVLIGGGLLGAWDLFIEELTKEAFKRAFKPFSANIRILKSSLAKDAGSIGAAGLLFKKLSLSHEAVSQPVI
ncbi:MAG: ROK family protein [Nitrospirae bacterium]|nr:ROK family protein [Nitrospirota bacterium]